MEGPLRVFLSHTSELRQYPADRSLVASTERAVLRTGNAVLDMEYFTTREDKPADYCRRQVGQDAGGVWVRAIAAASVRSGARADLFPN